jgi:tetratricopeptide (TPR) repeat protein
MEAQLNDWHYTAIKLFDLCLQEGIWIFGDDGPGFDHSPRAMTDQERALFLLGRGASYQTTRDRGRALADYDEAIRLRPDDDRAYSNRGVLHREMGACGLAIQDLEKAIALSPTDPAGYGNAARVFATCKDGRHRDGTKAVRLALTALPMSTDRADRARVLNALAEAYAESGRFAAAVSTAQQAIAAAVSPDQRLEFEQHLAAFKQNRPWRE